MKVDFDFDFALFPFAYSLTTTANPATTIYLSIQGETGTPSDLLSSRLTASLSYPYVLSAFPISHLTWATVFTIALFPLCVLIVISGIG